MHTETRTTFIRLRTEEATQAGALDNRGRFAFYNKNGALGPVLFTKSLLLFSAF